jgi:hypothetical protein
MNSKSKKVAILAAFALFSITFNSCKNCSKEAGHEDGNDTASDTSSSTDATDSADQAGSTDTTDSDLMRMPSVSVESQALVAENIPKTKVGPNGTIDPAQWEEFTVWVNYYIDELRDCKEQVLRERDAVSMFHYHAPSDFGSVNRIWDKNARVAFEEIQDACAIIKTLLRAWNGWQAEAANDTSSTADDTKRGMEGLRGAVQTALNEATLAAKAALETCQMMSVINENRLAMVRDERLRPEVVCVHETLILLEITYTFEIYLAPFVGASIFPLDMVKAYLRKTKADKRFFRYKPTPPDRAQYIKRVNDYVAKLTRLIEDDNFSQLLADSGISFQLEGIDVGDLDNRLKKLLIQPEEIDADDLYSRLRKLLGE